MKLLTLLTLALCASVAPLSAQATAEKKKSSTSTTSKKSTTTKKKTATTTKKPTTKTTTKPASKTTTKPVAKTTTKPAAKTDSSKKSPSTTTSKVKPATDSKTSTDKKPAKSTTAKKASGSWKVEANEADQAKAKKFASKMSSSNRASLLKVLNKGTKAEMLASLKGVGETKVQYLLKGRPYKTVDGLVNVNGFGVKTLEGLFADFNTKK